VQSPDITARMEQEQLEPLTATPQQISQMMASDKEMYTKAFSAVGEKRQ